MAVLKATTYQALTDLHRTTGQETVGISHNTTSTIHRYIGRSSSFQIRYQGTVIAQLWPKHLFINLNGVPTPSRRAAINRINKFLQLYQATVFRTNTGKLELRRTDRDGDWWSVNWLGASHAVYLPNVYSKVSTGRSAFRKL